MSKAEKFISEHTRDDSNIAFDASFGHIDWLTPDQARKAVEIAREEVIEKVVKWLIENTHNYEGYEKPFVIFNIVETQKEMINALKIAMENE